MVVTIRVTTESYSGRHPKDHSCAFQFKYKPVTPENNDGASFDIFKIDIPVPDEISDKYNLDDYKLVAYKYRNKYYILATEILRGEELDKLQKFCSCEKCKLWKFDIRRCFMCGCCHGCLFAYDGDLFYSNQYIINESRKAYQQHIDNHYDSIKKQD